MSLSSPIAAHQPDPQGRVVRAGLFVMAAFVILLPFIYEAGAKDAFRGPKEFVLRGVAVVLAAIALLLVIRAPRTVLAAARTIRVDLAIAGAIIGWTVVTTLLSTNRLRSVDALATVFASAAFYVAARLATRRTPSPWMLDIVLIPAALTAVLAFLQEYQIWQPLRLDLVVKGHLATTALIGNPDDVGTYLVAPLLAALLASVKFGGGRRAMYLALSTIISVGVVASGTRGAYVGLLAGLAVMVLLLGRRFIVAGIAAFALVIAIAFIPGSPLYKGIERAVTGWQLRQLDLLFSHRLPAFLAAWDMTRDHPATGVGPGAFAYQFMDYHRALQGRYPDSWLAGWQMNFGFVHNDHLQVLSETGWPGYALLLLVCGVAAAPSFGRRDPDASPAKRTATLLALPLVVGIFVTAITQFPLQIAAARCIVLYLVALARSAKEHHA